MPTPRLMAIHVEGPDTEPDKDIQDSDSVILIPYSIVNAAMEISEKEGKKVYVYKENSGWAVKPEDEGIPINIDLNDKKKVLCFEKDKLLSHEYFATI